MKSVCLKRRKLSGNDHVDDDFWGGWASLLIIAHDEDILKCTCEDETMKKSNRRKYLRQQQSCTETNFIMSPMHAHKVFLKNRQLVSRVEKRHMKTTTMPSLDVEANGQKEGKLAYHETKRIAAHICLTREEDNCCLTRNGKSSFISTGSSRSFLCALTIKLI